MEQIDFFLIVVDILVLLATIDDLKRIIMVLHARNARLKAFIDYFCNYQQLSYEWVSKTFSDLFRRSLSRSTLAKTIADCSRNLTGSGRVHPGTPVGS